MNEVAWANLEEDKQNPQPTAPVGWPVQWYPRGDKTQAVPAQVAQYDGEPGKVKLACFPVNAFTQHKKGVYHASAKIHEKAGNPSTVNNGSWGYCPGDKIPKEHYDIFNETIAKREANLLKGEEEAKKNEELFKAKQAERESGKKKPLPAPLPAPF